MSLSVPEALAFSEARCALTAFGELLIDRLDEEAFEDVAALRRQSEAGATPEHGELSSALDLAHERLAGLLLDLAAVTPLCPGEIELVLARAERALQYAHQLDEVIAAESVAIDLVREAFQDVRRTIGDGVWSGNGSAVLSEVLWTAHVLAPSGRLNHDYLLMVTREALDVLAESGWHDPDRALVRAADAWARARELAAGTVREETCAAIG